MKKNFIRTLAGALALSMAVSLMPAVPAKAEEKELPTIEELCEIADPVIGGFWFQKCVPWGYASADGWSTLSTYIRLNGGDFRVEEVDGGYRIVNNLDERQYQTLIIKNGELIEVRDRLYNPKNADKDGYWPSGINPVNLVCSNPDHRPGADGKAVGRHYYVDKKNKDGSYTYYQYLNEQALEISAELSRNDGNVGTKIYNKYGQIEENTMYFKNDETGEYEKCSNEHLNHIMINDDYKWHQKEIPGTCLQPGVKEHYLCPGCGEYLDVDGNVIDYKSLFTPIDPTNHAYGTIRLNSGRFVIKANYCYDTEYHWKNKLCDHDVDKYLPKEKHDNTSKKCGICNWHPDNPLNLGDDYDGEYADFVHSAEHKLTYHKKVPATCFKEGTRDYYECWRCPQNFDKDGNVLDDLVLPKDPNNHVYSDKYYYDTEYHWKEKTCNHDADKHGFIEEHNYNNDMKCSCGYNRKKPTVVKLCDDYDGEYAEPSHNKLHIGCFGKDMKEDATCLNEGHLAYYYCYKCDLYYDESDMSVIENIVIPIDPNAHIYSKEWESDNDYHWHPATCGHAEAKCDYIEHQFVNGVCSDCGRGKPSSDDPDKEELPTWEQIYTVVDPVLKDFGGVTSDTSADILSWSVIAEGSDKTLVDFLVKKRMMNPIIKKSEDGAIRAKHIIEDDYVDFYFKDGDINGDLQKIVLNLGGKEIELKKYEIPAFNCKTDCHADTHYYVQYVNEESGLVKVIAYSKSEGEWKGIKVISTENTFTDNGIKPEVGKMYHEAVTSDEKEKCLKVIAICNNTEEASAHEKGTYHKAVAATCEKEGNIEYYECSSCGTFMDANGSVLKSVVVPKDIDSHTFVDGKCTGCGYVKEDDSKNPSEDPSKEPSVNPSVKPSEAPVIVKGTSYDTLEVSEILKSNGKFKALTVSENNGILTVPAGTKLELSNANWSVKGYYDGRVVSANQIKWEATSGDKAANKALKKYAATKFNKKANTTKITTKANKKVAGSVYAVKLVDDKGNTIILNIERDEINKAVKKTKLSKADSKKSVSANALASMKDSTGVKTVNLSLAGLDESKKSAFNNNAITWIVGSGKNAVVLKPGVVTSFETKKGTVAYLTVTDDASVKILSGDTKGTIKLSATVDRKSFKTSIKVK